MMKPSEFKFFILVVSNDEKTAENYLNCYVARDSSIRATVIRIRIFIEEEKAIQNSIILKTTSLYISTNTFQANNISDALQTLLVRGTGDSSV